MSEAAAAVRWLLDQAEPEARRVAVQQIAKVRGRQASELLLRALGDDDWRVRKEATLAAPAVEPRDELVAGLIVALEETVNIGLRNASVEALVAVGPDVAGSVVDALSRFDADARKLAVEVLGGIACPSGTDALVRSLADEDANVSVAAAEGLGGAAMAGDEAREQATRALVDVLGSSNVFLKIAALDSLARLGARLPWVVFEPFAADPMLRRYAIAAAAGSREEPAVRALAAAVSDPSPTISRDAIIALGDLLASGDLEARLVEGVRGFVPPAGHDAVRRTARDAEDARARGGALLVLGLLRHPADVALLVEGLGDDEVAERADRAMRLFGPAVVAPLIASAQEAPPALQAAALSLAASIEGADAAEIRRAVRESLASPAPEVTSCAVEVLGALGDDGDLRRAAQLMWHADERVSEAAMKAVSSLASRHVEAARALLRDSRPPHDPLVLGCVLLGAIASTEPLEDDDVHLLERALEHDDPAVRCAAIDALARAGGEAAADAVAFALSDEEREVQFTAIRALGRLGRAEPLVAIVSDPSDPLLAAAGLRALGDADPYGAMAAAKALVRHADPAIACAAVEAVGQLDESTRGGAAYAAEGEDALFSALDHPDAEVVKLALSIVGLRRGTRSLVRLGLCLDHPSWEVRRLAAESLAHDSSSAAQRLLRLRYERESDPIVREAIATAVSMRPSAADFTHSDRAEPSTSPQGWKVE